MKPKEKKKVKKIINRFIIIVILVIMIGFGVIEYQDKKLEKEQNTPPISYLVQNINSQIKKQEDEEQTTQEKTKEKEVTKTPYPKETILATYKGYKVSAKLEIPTISLETYVLKQYSKNALNTSVTKFWGADPNQIGNFCIAGHNFQNKNMFHDLKKLQKGDFFFISDNLIGKVKYQIYDIYTVLPEDVTCLSQQTNQNREVTLITCTSDSKKRIIVKARECMA